MSGGSSSKLAETTFETKPDDKLAAIDVYEKEPFISEKLLSMDNVVLSPHSGTATHEGRNAMGAFACQNIIRFFQGDNRITRVN